MAFVYQPRAHLPLGLSMSNDRAEARAGILQRYPEVGIIEDDPLGPLCGTPAASVGSRPDDLDPVVLQGSRPGPALERHRRQCAACGGDPASSARMAWA
ncbi:hypothetical protein [Mesorhizobium waimense]|nr:hypothetical protein [Mesorhizobium waimense]